jgi:hypothetical protein
MAFEEHRMTRSEPRDSGRPVRLHGLLALVIAACIAIGAIAAAVALLDDAARAAGASSASQSSGLYSAGSRTSAR